VSDGPDLRWTTPRAWAERALERPLELLCDHAHCELGAAASAQGLIARYPDEARLVDPLASLAAEELRHFRRVHVWIVRGGGALTPIRKNEYAESLVRAIDRGRPDALLDRLLVAGLIERRSLERFELLAEVARARPEDEERAELGAFFAALAPSEAGHARLFVDLAKDLFPSAEVAARLEAWERREAELVQGLPFAHRIHSGPPLPARAATGSAGGPLAPLGMGERT